jgi:transposase-like protein
MNLTDPVFADPDKAREHLEGSRWPQGPICSHCGVVGEATYVGGKAARVGVWQCNACRGQFSVTTGTVFESSKIPLNKWLLATYLISSSKKGYSAHQLHRTLGITYKSAWFMAHRIREALKPANPGPLGGEGKVVEADTTYVGGKEKNKHKAKRDPKKIGGMGKQVVHVLIERGGHARAHHIMNVANVTGATLRPILVKHVSRKSALMTDTDGSYYHVGKEFARHEAVNHTKGEYVRGDAYSNSAENYFSILKRGINGTFHHVSEAHLSRYLAEFDFRYSHRAGLGVDDTARMALMLDGIAGKRLTYRRTDKAA